jgi:hypothetical protein
MASCILKKCEPQNNNKKRKFPTTFPSINKKDKRVNKHYWVHLNHPKTAKHNFGVRTEDPEIRKGFMYGCNAFWLTPTGEPDTSNIKKTYMVQGGATTSSHYVTEINEYSNTASILLLRKVTGVNVVLLKPKEVVFEGYTKKQIEAVWVKKKDLEKLSPPDIHEIADRIHRSNGGQGISRLQSVSLKAFQEATRALASKKPMFGAPKVNLNLTKIKNLIASFETVYNYWNSQDGNNSHMYVPQRAAVINELAEFLRCSEISRFQAAFELLQSDKAKIQQEASTLASTMGIKASTNADATTTMKSNAQLMYELKLSQLIGCVNIVANAISHLDVVTPQKTLCQNMIEQPSALMNWIGNESVPTVQDMLSACNDDTGLCNDNTRKILSLYSENIWYGVLCATVLCYKTGIDCSQIQGEKRKTGTQNIVSVYDRDGHLGKVKRHSAQPHKHVVPRTFCISYAGVLRESKHIAKAWKKLFKELIVFANKQTFWNDTNIADTFSKLQITIEEEGSGSLRTAKKKWKDRNDRKKVLSHLKWVFILYYESLPANSEPSLNNFLTTLMSPLGACMCNAYLAWVATGVYNLRIRYMQQLPVPSWIAKHKTEKTIPTIENTLNGAPASLLFRALEALIFKEFPSKNVSNSILNSVQANAVSHPHTHGNTRVGCAAGARLFWLLGAIRINERFAPRDSIVDEIRVMDDAFWKSIQPDKNHQKELRTGLSFIYEPFGTIKLVLAQSKVTGADREANSSKFNKKKCEIQLFTRGGGIHSDYTSLESILHPFLDAAKILNGDPKNRQYLVEVKDTDGMWMTMTATHVPTPANPIHKHTCMMLPQEKGQRVPYPQLFANFQQQYMEIRTQNHSEKKLPKKFCATEKTAAHREALSALGATMCYMPPKSCKQDHTDSSTASTKSGAKIRELFVDICSAMAENQPITLKNSINGCRWNLQSIIPPGVGQLDEHSVYTMKAENTLDNLVTEGWSHEDIKSVKHLCQVVANGELIVHPRWYGRQTQISKQIGLLLCARQIQGWQIGEPSTDGVLTLQIHEQAHVSGHEGNGNNAEKVGSIIREYYTKTFKTALGNPQQYFEHFDARIRAHPTPAIFSLDGIVSFPSTIVPCVGFDASKSPLERALKDVRQLTASEQIQNLFTLTVYKNLLEFIIARKNDLPAHQQCVLRWFGERASFNPSNNLEQKSRPKKKKKKMSKV